MPPWVHPDKHGWISHPRSDDEWNRLVAEYGGAYPEPFQQIVRVVREGGCRTVVVENRYVDVDYRSEYSSFWSLRFQSPSPFARRLHFFKRRLTTRHLYDLPENVGYLGYSVIRPVSSGSVGRTVLAPPPSLAKATLAWVDDEVSLFGNPLPIRGVAFTQQDGEFLRCAQAAAWMCHYPAFRRGLVGRRPTAGLIELTPSMLSHERALPSKGMTLNQLQAVFGELGQPALFYGLTNMPTVRGVPDPAPKKDSKKRVLHPGHWDTRIFSVVCRYLNSGFPVLIGTQDHAFVLVGWFRKGKTVCFVACDDQKGPYEVISSPFSHYKTPWMSIMVPLPPKVFLTGESAESKAHRDFRTVALSVPALKPLADALLSGRIELRSSLKENRDYKRDIAKQTSSDKVLQALRFARLPHWVWNVEAHYLKACDSEQPCVFADALYDGTSSDLRPRQDALSLPGVVAVYPPDGGKPVVAAGGAAPWPSLLTAH